MTNTNKIMILAGAMLLTAGAMVFSAPQDDVLEPSEAQALAHMLEEEKLARDTYLALFETWNHPIFENIAGSEQQHMDTLAETMDDLGMDTSAAELPVGEFANADFAKLYADFTAQGGESLSAALTVGATIEDLDIADLLETLEGSAGFDDLRVAYQNLLKGSRNHLRSFNRLLERFGDGSYAAQFTDPVYLARILNTASEAAIITDPNYVF